MAAPRRGRHRPSLVVRSLSCARPKTFDPEEKKGANVDELQRRLERARADLEQRRERLAWSERMFKRGYIAASQTQADEAHLRAAEAALQRAEAELEAARRGAKK